MFPIREFFSTLKEEKNGEWADKVITYIRFNWRPLVSQQEAETGMAYLLSYQDMAHVKKLFQNTTRINLTNENRSGGGLVNHLNQPVQPSTAHDAFYLKEMQGQMFKPLTILEKHRNVIIAEMKKMGCVVNVRSIDPTSTPKRNQDKDLIKHKNEIESLFSYIYTSIGQQPYKVEQHKSRFGEKPDNGNTEQFEAMGLDSSDPADIDFFMKEFHKLDEEIAVQDIIDYISIYNQWELDMEKWVNDIMAKKAIAAVCYVSDVTGAIRTKYLAPETVFIYGGGNRQDFNDASAKGYERKVTVKELLDILGDKFDMEREFNNLMQAITNTERLEFTGVKPSYRGFALGQDKLTASNGNTYTWNDFMSFKVTLGYIEFTSQNQETFGQVPNDGAFYENNQSPDKYPSKARWETPTYKAYYLAISQVSQVLYDFGELNYQDILGYSDYNVNGTIVTYKGVGDPIAIQAAEVIDMVNEAWYKWRYELRRAKPRGRGWNYDSVITSMMDLIPDTNISSFNKLQKVMELLDSSSNEFYSFPVIEGKPVLLPGNQLNYDIPNGLSKESMLWWEIMMNGIQYISDLIGFSPLREGDPGNPRDSMNNQFKALEYSQATTYYVPDMLTFMFQQLSVKANFYAQDIINYKDYNSVAYKFLEDAVGEETISKLESLGKTAQHRFGIFVESLNQAPLRAKLDQLIQNDIQKGSLTTIQSLLINDIKSVKKAYVTLAYFEQRNRKLAEKSQAEQSQQATQQQIAVEKEKQNTEKIKGEYMLANTRIESASNEKVHEITQQGQLTKQAFKQQGDINQTTHEAITDLRKELAIMANQKLQTTSLPEAPPIPQQETALPPQQQALGQVSQLQDNVAPGSQLPQQ